MAQTASLDPESPASLLDLMRANDALFLLMKAGYRKAFLANPKGDVPFSGPTLYGLLSLMDDVDKSIIIQNFLVTHYQLENIPLLFYYHAALQKSGDETVYRLRPAFPVVQGEIEEFLSDKLKQEWAYCMANGCMHRVSTAENLVALNAEAVLKLARDAVERKFILSAKALAILKEEVLAPIDAVYQREFDELAKRMDLFEPLKKATPRFITDMLAGIETRELAMACVGSEDILVLLDRGMSQGRRADIRAEVAVEKKRFERGEFSVQKLLDAKRRLIALVRNLPGAEMGAEMEADTDPEKDPEAAI